MYKEKTTKGFGDIAITNKAVVESLQALKAIMIADPSIEGMGYKALQAREKMVNHVSNMITRKENV